MREAVIVYFYSVGNVIDPGDYIPQPWKTGVAIENRASSLSIAGQ